MAGIQDSVTVRGENLRLPCIIIGIPHVMHIALNQNKIIPEW